MTTAPASTEHVPRQMPDLSVYQRVIRMQAFQILLVLIGIIIVFSALAPDTFPTLGNMRLIVQNVSILAILGVGMTYVIITSGIDLSIGSVLVFSGVIAAKADAVRWAATGGGPRSSGSPLSIVGGLCGASSTGS